MRKVNPAPLTPKRVWAILAAATRELLWGLRGVSCEVSRWRVRAACIPDLALREDALAAINKKRGNIDGAALFWILPSSRSPDLLRLLVSYEILADFLDCASERGAYVGPGNGLRLHRALFEALDPDLSVSDYYKQHPWKDDGGYLYALVDSCRQACSRLPSYDAVKPSVLRAAGLAQVLALNHEPDPLKREAALRGWAETHFDHGDQLAWFELTGGASAWLTVLALLALAAESELDAEHVLKTYAAYLPWVSLSGTMLDSYGDMAEDAASTAHSYIAHYQNIDVATKRVAEIIRRSLREVGALPGGERHVVITSCMIAMYLTKDSTRTPEMRETNTRMARAGGSPTRLMMPVLRFWRLAYGQGSA